MNIDSTLLNKMRALMNGKGGGAPRPSILPVREWGMSLLVTFVVALILFGIAGYDFYEQLTDRAMPVVSEEHIPRYRASDAEFLIRYHEGRQETFKALRDDKPYIPPPVNIEGEANAGEEGSVAGERATE